MAKAGALCGLLLLFACAGPTGGDVVTVTTVDNGQYRGLDQEERARLEEIRKARDKGEIDSSLSSMIQETPHFSVAQYLSRNSKAPGAGGGDYRVGGYDVLNIMVYEEPDLSRDKVRVSGKGEISFPLIGRVRVQDLTTSEIEKRISRRLAHEEYLLDAHVSVLVTEFNSRKFLVLGAAKAPGSYSLKARERVLDAVSRAGGVSEGAGKQGMIIRTENPDTARERRIVIDLDLQALLKGEDQISNIYVADRDVLYIPSAEHFYIIGEVRTPGSYPLTNREITLVEAISMAGGFTQVAARNKSRIIRVEKGVEKIIQVQVDAITEAGKKIQDVIIRPNDIIVVPESFF